MTAADQDHDQDLTLTVERVIDAPPERVFDAWLDPGMIKRFLCPGDGTTVPRAEVDPREGGRFEFIMNNGTKDLPHTGVYKRIDRPHRLVFTWESDASIAGSTVTISFSPRGKGTLVSLTQVQFAGEEARDGHVKGWTRILENLAALR